MALDSTYRIDDVSVVSDVIAGEAVILHRGSGYYFSTDGTGCLIWQWIGDGHGCDSIVKALSERFAGKPEEIKAAVDAFLADLVAHRLIQELGEDAGASTEVPVVPSTPVEAEFVTPVLHVYSDIRSLILLDPIHEVAQAGWPVPA